MDYKDIIRNIKSKNFENIYLLYGREYYLIDNAIKNLKESLNESMLDFNLDVIDGKEVFLDQLLSSVETLPFMDDNKITIVKDFELLKGKRKNAIEDKKARKELTDNLIEKIIELNPDLSDKELKQMITDKLLVMKTRNVISLKPIEDRFKERIDKYMSQAKEVRLK